MQNQLLPFRNRNLSTWSNQNRNLTTLVFLHGNSCSTRLWDKQFNSDLDERYHLIGFDFMGFGDSDHSDSIEDYSISSLKDSVRHFIQEEHLDHYVIIGHSLGGHVVHQLCNELPGCIGIVSIGAPPISLPPDISKIYLPTAPLGVMFQKDFTEEDLDLVTSLFFHDTASAPAFFKTDFRKSDSNTRAAIGATLADPLFKDEVVELTRCQLPKLFISGENETSINNHYYETLHFPNTWKKPVHTIPNSSHVPQWENPDVVNALIDGFVNGIVNRET